MHETNARAWCTGKTQRDRGEREVGGGIRMGNTCKSMADSCQCMKIYKGFFEDPWALSSKESNHWLVSGREEVVKGNKQKLRDKKPHRVCVRRIRSGLFLLNLSSQHRMRLKVMLYIILCAALKTVDFILRRTVRKSFMGLNVETVWKWVGKEFPDAEHFRREWVY